MRFFEQNVKILETLDKSGFDVRCNILRSRFLDLLCSRMSISSLYPAHLSCHARRARPAVA
jgi:hypothetical protein